MQINKLSVMSVNNNNNSRSKTLGQMSGKHSTLWLTCALLAASWLLKCPLNGLVPQLKQVEATLWPKARICFNSMTSSFQSECVYCDSRLYASTINACTGQPVLAANITQAQAFCIATACLQQTGKQPVVLGRRRRKRRSLQFRPFGGVGAASKNLSYGGSNYNKQYNKTSINTANGNVSAQFDKLMNGTTSGNLNFVLHRPNYNSLWANNPLTRVLVRNATNKNIQWQFGRGTASTSVAVTKAASSTGASATVPAPSAAAAPPKPAAPPAAPPKPAAPPAAPPKPAAPAAPAG